LLNILNGGLHADNNLEIQEFMIVPLGAESFHEAMRMAAEVFHALKKILKERGLSTGVGDEGGFAPDLGENRDALELIVEGIERSGWEPGKDIYLAIDAAASSFFADGHYELEGRSLSSRELIGLYESWVEEFPIVSLEDGLAEEDWSGWRELTERLGGKIQLIGDDIFVTNPRLLERGLAEGVANSILIKPNQIGTLTETLETMELARGAGYTCVISHRSGETEDPFIADLAVGTGSGQLKSGSPNRSERVAKYNQLLRIEEDFGLPLRSTLWVRSAGA
jgi:enolase